MKTKKLLTISLVLYLLAIAFSAYLISAHYDLLNGEAGFHSICSINSVIDCEAVNGSVYSEVLGIPVATLGFSLYLLSLILTIVALVSRYSRREAVWFLTTLSGAGVAVTFVMAGITAVLLKKVCLFCSGLYFINISTFLLSILVWKSLGLPGGFIAQLGQCDKKKQLAYAASGLGILLLSQLSFSQLSHPMPFDADTFTAEFHAQPVLSVEPGDGPRMGNTDPHPPIQIVEFADFQCPACGYAAKQMHRLLASHGKLVQFIFRNFPLSSACNPHVQVAMHLYACKAALAGVCANRYGKFPEMYEKLFENQQDLSDPVIEKVETQVGIPPAEFKTCLSDVETALRIRKDVDAGGMLSIASTPTFFVNGRRVEGAIDEARFRVILKELKITE